MSYYLPIQFYPDIPPETLLEKIQDICTSELQTVPQQIQENIELCPAHPFQAKVKTFKEFRNTNNFRINIRFFIEHFYKNTFLYYPQYNLLGQISSQQSPDTVTIAFQNCTDQDYSLDTWNSISLFERIRDEILEECSSTPNLSDYDLRTSIYDRIETELRIQDYLYHPDNLSPISFTISFATSQQMLEFEDIASKLVRQAWKKWEADRSEV